jgi:hypothetical protein
MLGTVLIVEKDSNLILVIQSTRKCTRARKMHLNNVIFVARDLLDKVDLLVITEIKKILSMMPE